MDSSTSKNLSQNARKLCEAQLYELREDAHELFPGDNKHCQTACGVDNRDRFVDRAAVLDGDSTIAATTTTMAKPMHTGDLPSLPIASMAVQLALQVGDYCSLHSRVRSHISGDYHCPGHLHDRYSLRDCATPDHSDYRDPGAIRLVHRYPMPCADGKFSATR
jgi:hypothetical protein